MEDAIQSAKGEFIRAKGRLARALQTTPEDKVNWSPSPSSRTPVAIVAHAALSVEGMQEWMMGKGFDFDDMNDLDAMSLEQEKAYETREAALALLEEKSAAFVSWLESLTAEQLSSTISASFGSFPLAVAVTFPADHIRGHAAQIDYIQTILGDRGWH